MRKSLEVDRKVVPSLVHMAASFHAAVGDNA
jgi:hypothetical protein